MTAKSKKPWYVVTAGSIGAIIAVITLFGMLGWVLPWKAAAKSEVTELREMVIEINGKLDALLKDGGIHYVPVRRKFDRSPHPGRGEREEPRPE
jgi:hypothetical protein